MKPLYPQGPSQGAALSHDPSATALVVSRTSQQEPSLPDVFPAGMLPPWLSACSLPHSQTFFVTLGSPSLTILFKIACPLNLIHYPPFSVLFYFLGNNTTLHSKH